MNRLYDSEGQLNIEAVIEMMETYHEATNIPIFYIDSYGKRIGSVGEDVYFCQLINEHAGNSCPCDQTHLYAGKQAAELGEAYIFSCPAGLVHFTVSTLKNGFFSGAFMAGPVLLNYPDEIMIDEIVQKYDFSLNLKGRIESYLKTIWVIGPQKVRQLSRILFLVVLSLMPDEKATVEQRLIKRKQQSRISESIHRDKEREQILDYYPYDKEKELVRKVRNGDLVGSRAILNEMLGHIFLTTGGNLEIIKSRVLELCTLLSRAAVEGGASLETIFGMNLNFISTLGKIDSIEELSFWTLKILERFTESVFDLSKSKHAGTMIEALKYINAHYEESLTLEKVAGKVHLNPAYLSSLFKKEIGVGFTEYLNKIRVEESKKLLKNRQITILEVALSVGFENHSYFSKVFKTHVGKTPTQYRNALNDG